MQGEWTPHAYLCQALLLRGDVTTPYEDTDHGVEFGDVSVGGAEGWARPLVQRHGNEQGRHAMSDQLVFLQRRRGGAREGRRGRGGRSNNLSSKQWDNEDSEGERNSISQQQY